MVTKLVCPLFYLFILCLSPILIWIVIYQLILDRKICINRRLYKENKLNNRIYARKCEVREISNYKVAKYFLRYNHLFGVFINLVFNFHNSKLVGLYYNDKLVYVSCFKKKKDSLYCFAMCSLTNYTVVGGASKTLKHIEQPITTISFRRSTLYETLGFEEDGYCNLFEMLIGKHSKTGLFKYWKRG